MTVDSGNPIFTDHTSEAVNPQEPSSNKPTEIQSILDEPTMSDAWTYLTDNIGDFEKGWLRHARPTTLHDSALIISVADEFARTQVESRVRPTIEGLLAHLFGRPISVAITIDPNLNLNDDRFVEETLIEEDAHEDTPITLTERGNFDEAHLNPKYTFDTFVIGDSNRFAHAAAIAVAENPGNAFNPLLIYGDSGLGKTHLLHAIGHYVQNYQEHGGEHLRVKYVSTEELTNDFINSIAVNKMAEFRRRYREDIDVLLVDDIQFIESKDQTQEEFFHTFNALHTSQKQIVITSDRHPHVLTSLEPRLRSRFEWGLMTDVQPPSLETRMAILRRKVVEDNLNAGNDVLEFIASRIQTNIRELEGALIRVTAYASLQHQPLHLSLAEQVLEDLLPSDTQLLITPELIQTEVSEYYQVSFDALIGPDRTQNLATARQVAMYLCRELTNLSLPKIGHAFGGRDHTTVIHAVGKIKNLLKERRDLFDQVTDLTNRIKSSAR